MRRYKLFGILCFIFFSTGPVYGQGSDNRPNSAQRQPVMVSRIITVRETRDLPNDSWVTLNGNIINALPGGKYYTFRDSSGEIVIEVDWKVWRGLSIGVSDRIEISGEVKIKNRESRIKVKAIAGNGETIAGRYSSTVRQARNLPHDSWVVLTGNIVNFLGRENYTFRDSPAFGETAVEITVEIEREIWRGLSANLSDLVEISGEVKIKRGQVSIEVKAIRKI